MEEIGATGPDEKKRSAMLRNDVPRPEPEVGFEIVRKKGKNGELKEEGARMKR